MKKMILTLLVTLSVTAISTPTPALAGVYDDTCIAGEDAKACLERVFETLLTTTSEAEAQFVQLRQAHASAVSEGDGAEVTRLHQLLVAKDAEIAELKRERDELRSQVASLQGQVTELSGKFDDLNARMTDFLAEEAETPVAKAAPPPAKPDPAERSEQPDERTIPVSEGETRLAVYERPELDPSVYGRMGYRNARPEIPDPMAFPDVWWEDAGNCLTVRNDKTDPVTGWVILRIAGITRVIDSTGHVVANEVPLGPGDEFDFCADTDAPRMSITPAMRSKANSAERHWSDFERRWVPLQRNHSGTYHPHEWFGADRLYDIN